MKDKADFVLDSFALLAYVQNEPGAARVESVLAQAQKGPATIYLSLINYGEAIYITERGKGLTATQDLIALVDQLPIAVVEADRKLTFAAAHLKAQHPISYADAFALALAQQKQAVLLTGDPEFRRVESLVTVEWLPQA